MQLPDLALYYEASDLFLDGYIGSQCTLFYEVKTVCPNCKPNPMGGGVNIYKSGGPYVFSVGVCPYCNGTNYKINTQTENIRLRVYFRPKDWIKVANVEVIDGRIQVIGYLTDLPKLRKANSIQIVSDQTYQKLVYKLAGDPLLHGFKKNRYFLCFMDRI